MTSLEFVEKEIENIKEFLSDSVNVIGKNTKDSDFWEQRLHHLQQIKAELEAWEICKKHHHINKYDKKRFDITIWLNAENCDFESCASYEECLKVKKALEVKHE